MIAPSPARIIVALALVAALSGCNVQWPQVVQGCILAEAAARVGTDVAEGGAAKTAGKIDRAADDGCDGVLRAAAVH